MKRFVLSLVVCIWTCATTHVLSQEPLFTPAPSITVGPGSGKLFFLDFNRDGHIDLLAKHLLGRRLSVRLGDAKGRFAPAAKAAETFDYQPGTIALGNVNNDTISDLGVAKRDAAGNTPGFTAVAVLSLAARIS